MLSHRLFAVVAANGAGDVPARMRIVHRAPQRLDHPARIFPRPLSGVLPCGRTVPVSTPKNRNDQLFKGYRTATLQANKLNDFRAIADAKKNKANSSDVISS
jgi:hypothetical protein